MTSTPTLLEDVFLSPDDRELVEAVIKAACIFFQVEREDLINDRKLAKTRHLCFDIISNNTHLNEKTIGEIFCKGRTAVQYGISQMEVHKKIYRQTLGNINSIVAIANTFDKKHTWHIH
jgi:hypothetical protein